MTSLTEVRAEYAALLEEARALLELGHTAIELRPRVRELVGRLNELSDEARRAEDELREIHRRAYHLETCLEGSESRSGIEGAAALPDPFPPEEREQPGTRSRPSGLAS